MAQKGNKKGEWVRRHVNDAWVKRAVSQGYRSRAVYKLQEIDEQDKLIKSGMTIIDLGSTPGGWSQYIARKHGSACKTIAVDLIEMDNLDQVQFLHGDFQDPDILKQLDELLDGCQVDLVISDMAPNINGVRSVDEAQFEGLLDSVLYFSDLRLKVGGNLLVKLFEGSAAHYFRKEVRSRFQSGVVRKPNASRPGSREFYFLAKNKKPI